MSVLMGRGALALWLDVAPELDRETDGWYIDEHLPDRIDTGKYLRARRFEAVQGAPQYLSLFEATTPAALASEGYLSLVNKISDQSQRIRSGFSNVIRNTFDVRISSGRGIGAVMASLRLKQDAAGNAQAAVAAMDAQVPQLLREHGVVGVHWMQAAPEVRRAMDSVRVTGLHDGSADYVLLLETSRVEDVRALREGVLSTTALAARGWREDGFGIYSLLYEVSALDADREIILGDRR
jgi:hypothetical protein